MLHGRRYEGDAGRMQALMKILALVVFASMIGGFVFLAAWDVPKPTETVVKTMENERFFGKPTESAKGQLNLDPVLQNESKNESVKE